MINCTALATQLNNSFIAGVEIKKYNDACVVITPMLRHNFDHIQIYIESSNHKVRISDEGETAGDLLLSGLDLSSEKQIYEEVTRIAKAHRLQFDDFAFSIEVEEMETGNAALRMLNAMQAASYLVYKVSSRPRSKFTAYIESFLIESKIPYQPRYEIRGATSTNRFAYYVNGSRNILIDALTTTSANVASKLAIQSKHKRDDLRKANLPMTVTALLDDRKGRGIWELSDAISVLSGYNVHFSYWTEREERLLPLLVG